MQITMGRVDLMLALGGAEICLANHVYYAGLARVSLVHNRVNDARYYARIAREYLRDYTRHKLPPIVTEIAGVQVTFARKYMAGDIVKD